MRPDARPETRQASRKRLVIGIRRSLPNARAVIRTPEATDGACTPLRRRVRRRVAARLWIDTCRRQGRDTDSSCSTSASSSGSRTS